MRHSCLTEGCCPSSLKKRVLHRRKGHIFKHSLERCTSALSVFPALTFQRVFGPSTGLLGCTQICTPTYRVYCGYPRGAVPFYVQ